MTSGHSGVSPGENPQWRLIVTGPADGPLNMAIDEALLVSAISGGRPALRIYSWDPPAVSLGYFQDLDDQNIDRAEIVRRGYDLVRRPTGGRAILHKHEVTYSVTARQSDVAGGASLMGAYRTISRGVEAGLQLLGVNAMLAEKAGETLGPERTSLPTVCFGHPAKADMVAAGRKIVGSAQVRRRDALLQHGSIPISIDPTEHLAVMPGGLGNSGAHVADGGRLAAIACGVADIVDYEPTFEQLVQALADGFASALRIRIEADGLSDAETELAGCLRREKYADDKWTARRGDQQPEQR